MLDSRKWIAAVGFLFLSLLLFATLSLTDAGGTIYLVTADISSSTLAVDLQETTITSATTVTYTEDPQPQIQGDRDPPENRRVQPKEVQICCFMNYVYVAWTDVRDGKRSVFFNVSNDTGLTWLPKDIRVSDDKGIAEGVHPRLTCDQRSVYLVYEHHSLNGSQIRFNRSLDGGLTWLDKTVWIDQPAADEGFIPEIACTGSRVYIVWRMTLAGFQLHARSSDDSGTTWGALQKVATQAQLGYNQNPRIACDGNFVYVVWSRAIPNARWHVYVNSSPNAGVNWLADPVRICSMAGSLGIRNYAIGCEGNNVHVAFEEWNAQDAREGVHYNGSSDAGKTWRMASKRLDTGGSINARNADLRVRDSIVHVAWQDFRSAKFYDIYSTRSVNGGADWMAPDERIDVPATAAGDSVDVRLAVTPDNVHAVWLDDRAGGGKTVWARSSSDRGATWAPDCLRLDRRMAGTGCREARVCADWSLAYAVWIDDRTGADEIWVNASQDGGATWRANDTLVGQ